MTRIAAVFKTGVVIIPPKASLPPIQAIRADHDAKIARWMPHITLIYPFVPVQFFDGVADRLAPACQEIEPFEIHLNAFDTFRHGRDSFTLWLRPEPEAPLIELHDILHSATWNGNPPRSPHRRFRPHLSVGQARGRPAMLRLLEELRRHWSPLAFRVESVALIRRDDPPADVFEVDRWLPLGSSRTPGILADWPET